MKAVLTSSIPVERFAVFAEMACLERRPELGMLCRAARDNDNEITAAVVQSVLPGVTEAGAYNIIQWCGLLELCDRRGGLTALGEDVADTDEAPVPEQGVYDCWMVSHPVLGRRLLAVDRLAPSRDQRFDLIKPLRLPPDLGVTFSSVRDPAQRFIVRALPTNHQQVGVVRQSTRATCRFRWTLDFTVEQDSWHLDGTIESTQGGMVPIEHGAEAEGLDVWAVAHVWGRGPLAQYGRWLPQPRQLAVAFSDISSEEQETFRKSIELTEAEVPGKGRYQQVSLEDVPICPRSAEDAQDWAMARLRTRLSDSRRYRSRSEVRQLFAGLVEGTPLEQHRPVLPSHSDLVADERVRNDDELFWSLVAPVDLSPFSADVDDLGALQVGASAKSQPRQTVGTVRVPYRGGWSMRKLIDALIAGEVPKDVLLCDRYVRGRQNLIALGLFVDALRAAAPGARLGVWTRANGADFDRIRALTSRAPRAYGDLFGRAHPHDRYVLVRSESGKAFGWHLTNSPLHARADIEDPSPETPLRWKDLAGSRVVPESLEPALRDWLTGGAP